MAITNPFRPASLGYRTFYNAAHALFQSTFRHAFYLYFHDPMPLIKDLVDMWHHQDELDYPYRDGCKFSRVPQGII